MQRGDIYIADLLNNFGHVQRYKRPVLIIQNNKGNAYSGTLIVTPMTTTLKEYIPTHVIVSMNEGGLERKSAIQLEQILTIDKAQLLHKIGHLSKYFMKKVDEAIKLSLAIKDKREVGTVVQTEIKECTAKELQVINRNGQWVIDSRDVAEMIGKEHSNLMRDIRGYAETLDASENSNLNSLNFFIPHTYTVAGNSKQYSCYLITRKGCDMVANKMTGEKGVLFTAEYVTKFEEMEKAQNIQEYSIPKTYSEALRLAADLEEEKQKLLTENKEMKPKALFADSVTASSTSILVADLAKLLKQNDIETGEHRLWKWLRAKGYAIKEQGRSYNMPTQYSMERGIMEVKEGTYINSYGESTITKTTMITGKGQIYFLNKFLNKQQAI